ncbi:PKD domain-containing protein, partial [Anaerosacchariphilus polymeriproducens]
MFANYKNTKLKRIVALILAICLLPLSDFVDVRAKEINIQNEEKPSEKNEKQKELNATEDGGNKENENVIVKTFPIHSEIKKDGITLTWEAIAGNEVTYKIYRNDTLLSDTKELEFSDKDISASTDYSYKVIALDKEGKTLAESEITKTVVPDKMEITGDTTLTKNETVYSLDVKGGTLNLNGYKLTVIKDANLYRGLQFSDGSLFCNGNANFDNLVEVNMTNANDYLYVGGNFTWNSAYTSYNKLTNGVIEIKGDFNSNIYDSFIASNHHKILLSGESKQTISMKEGNSCFNTLELQNYSEEGIYSESIFPYIELIRNNCRLEINGLDGQYGFKLEEDVTIEGDFALGMDTLDLNGHILTIKGNLIQSGGEVFINAGKLFVEGDYRIQRPIKTGNETSVSYGVSSGTLKMTNENDYICVLGNFCTDSQINHTDKLTNGILEVKGDFTQLKTKSSYNFMASQNHKVVLSGEKKQTVSFSVCTIDQSQISNLEITNQSDEGVEFKNRPYVKGNVTDHKNKVLGYISIGSNTVLTDNSFQGGICNLERLEIKEPWFIGGDFELREDITISKSLNVEGDYKAILGRTKMENGTLIVKKNLECIYGSYNDTSISMTHETDKIRIYGSFKYNPYYSSDITAGIIEIKGNVEISRLFSPSGSHKVLLNGDKKQTINIADSCCFNILEIQNHSEEGIYSVTSFQKASLIRNGCRLIYGDMEGVFGWTLTEDTVINDNLILMDDTLDLNGFTLTVKGNFIQSGGTVNINGGKLLVEKDYRMQIPTGKEGNYTYSGCSSVLKMVKDKDYVLVKGSFYFHSYMDHNNLLTDGILEIQKDFYQPQEGSSTYYKFIATKNHKLLLSGDGKQIICAAKTQVNNLQIANLEITNNTLEGVEFQNEPFVIGKITDHKNSVSGTIAVGGNLNLDNGYYGGNISIVKDTYVNNEAHIGGNVSINASHTYLYVNNKLIIDGNYLQKSGCLFMNNGYLHIQGNCTALNESWGSYGIKMTHAADYIKVDGNFNYYYGYKGEFNAGTLEVKKSLEINNNFKASGTHRILLSGTSLQTLNIDERSKLNILELKNYSNEGIYSPTIFNKESLIRNGCKFKCGDIEGEFGWQLTDDTVLQKDFVLVDDTLDLNGHTLTVKGNLIQAGGVIKVNGGKLIIEGDYRIQVRKGEEGNYTYDKSAGYLLMNHAKDYVLVQGSFYTASIANRNDNLTDGVLEIKGDIQQIDEVTQSYNNFYCSKNHKILLSAKTGQTVKFTSQGYSRIQNLEIKNDSKEGVKFINRPFVMGTVVTNNNEVNGMISIGRTTLFSDNRFSGGIAFVESLDIKNTFIVEEDVEVNDKIYISGELTVNGNYRSSSNGLTCMEHGKLFIKKDLDFTYYSGGIEMENEDDFVRIDGKFLYSSYYNKSLIAGTMELNGDALISRNFYPKGNHKVILGSDKKQTIKSEGDCNFNILELKNYSNDGIYSEEPLLIKKLIRNGCKLVYGSVKGEFGYTLTEDTVIEGDYTLIGDTLDLNGHSLTIKGNFLHVAGNIIFHGGTLVVEEDYRFQSYKENSGIKTYIPSAGNITMNHTNDRFTIKGNCILQNKDSMSDWFYKGTLEIKGNFTQIGSYSFRNNLEHQFLLSGSEFQNLTFNTTPLISNFIVTNTSEKGVHLNKNVYINNAISDLNEKVTGTGVAIINFANQLKDGIWGGNLIISKDSKLDKNMIIGGNLTINAPFNVDKYTVSVGGNFYLDQNSRLIMQNPEAYVKVGNDFTIDSYNSHNGSLSDGVLEIKGDFRQLRTTNFIATGNHKTIFTRKLAVSGKAFIQTIHFNNVGTAKFHTLILKKDLASGYQLNCDINKIADEILYEIEDMKPPSNIKTLTKSQVTSSSVTLNYSGASDDTAIVGYAIYRDGTQIAITSSTSFKDSSVKPDQTYTYTVFAFDDAKNIAEDSPKLSVSTPADTQPPSKVEGLQVSKRTGSSITLKWDKSTDNVGTTGYKLYRNGQILANNLEKTTYKDETVKENVIYSYSIVANDAAGNQSEKSEEVESAAAMPQITYLSPEDNSRMSGNDMNLVLRFKNVGSSEDSKVNIEYQDETSNEWVPLTPQKLSPKKYDEKELYVSYKWDISGLKVSGDYKIRFTLYDADGNKDQEILTYNLDKTAPKIPAEFSGEDDNQVVVLHWKPSISADCNGYYIYKKAESQSEYQKLAAIEGRETMTFRDKEVELGKKYSYIITAYDECKNESESSETVVVQAGEDKIAPEIDAMTPEGGKITGITNLYVHAVDNHKVSSIKLEYKELQEESWKSMTEKECKDGQITYPWSTVGLKDGTYLIRASVRDDSGNVNIKLVTRTYEIDNTGISKIQLGTCTAGSCNIQLTWQDVKEEDFGYFRVEQLKDGKFVKVADVTNQLGYVVSGLKPNTEYTMRVVGYDKSDNRGNESDEIKLKTVSDTTAPSILMVNPSSSYFKDKIRFSVKVRDNHGVDKVVFSYSTDKINYTEAANVASKEKASEETLTYDWDVSGLKEGEVYVKVEAYDLSGNKNVLLKNGQDIIAEYSIDRTAPAAVKDLNAVGGEGYISLSWNDNEEKDIKSFQIFRAKAKDGIYIILESSCTTKNYYDTSVKSGESYLYKLAVVDIAGNISELSNEAAGTAVPDTVSPEILGLSPGDASIVGGKEKITIAATDNAQLKKVILEYQNTKSSDGIWYEIGTCDTNERYQYYSTEWNTKGLTEGSYKLRAKAIDSSGNISKSFIVTYTLDLTAPEPVSVTTKPLSYMVGITIGTCEADDFEKYKIYRRELSETSFTCIAETAENSYQDETAEVGNNYYYKVETYDSRGNCSESAVVSGYAGNFDNIAPKAVLPQSMIAKEGYEVAFDATASTDNNRIIKYSWDFGDGSKKQGAKPIHTFNKSGNYTVILTVTDAGGNEDKTYTTVKVLDKTNVGTTEVTIQDKLGKAIPRAYVYVKLNDDETINTRADDAGIVKITAEAGIYDISAYAQGYQVAESSIKISSFEDLKSTLQLNSGEVIEGKVSVKRMNLEEMVEAGVDLTDPENMLTYTFELSLAFEEAPLPIEYTYTGGYGSNKEIKLYGGRGGMLMFSGDYSGKKNTSDNNHEVVEPDKPVLLLLSTQQSVTWLKEMYDVQLDIFNTAQEEYKLESSTATLNLPDGVSLAETANGQNLIQSMGTIGGQEHKSASWVIKGDKSGKYKVGASFYGTMMPFEAEIKGNFESDTEFDVKTGEGIHIYVMPESSAFVNENYYVQFAIVNESNRDLYGFKTTLGPYIQPAAKQEVVVKDEETGEEIDRIVRTSGEQYTVTGASETSQLPVCYNGDTIKVNILSPGESVYGTWVTSIPNRIDGDESYFKLIETIVTELEGANTGVEVTVKPIPSHMTKSQLLVSMPKETYGDPVDTTTGAFADEINALTVKGATTLSLDLSYDSMMAQQAADQDIQQEEGEVGFGWSSNYENCIKAEGGILKFYENPNSYGIFVSEESLNGIVYGKQVGKETLVSNYKQGSGKYIGTTAGMKDYYIIKNEDGTYELHSDSDYTFYYTQNGKLARIKEVSGKSVSFEHKDKQTIVKEEVSGKKLYIHYNETGKIVSVTDDIGRKAGFSYDNNGNLKTFTNAAGESTIYNYDQNHRIISAVNNNNVTFVKNTYDEKGRVLSQEEAGLAGKAMFSYEDKDEKTVIKITNHVGDTTTIMTDEKGRVVKSIDPLGAECVYTYDRNGNRTGERQPDGTKVIKQYDEDGNMTVMYDTASNATYMTYDEKGNLISTKNQVGETTSYQYDENNNMISLTAPSGTTTTYEYNSYGLVVAETTAGLGTKRYSYSGGLLTSTTDYNGNISICSYDGAGNLKKVVDAENGVIEYSYDAIGRVLSINYPEQGFTGYEYDGVGNQRCVIDAKGNFTQYEYDTGGRKTKEIAPDGSEISYTYDGEGRVIKVTYPDNTTTTYSYDGAGNVLTQKEPNGLEYSYQYDLCGNLIQETSTGGAVTKYEYYPNGILYKKTMEDGQSILYTYDGKWNKISETVNGKYTTSYLYDCMGKVTAIMDPLGNKTTNSYDNHGRLISTTDANNNTTTYTYDGNGNCLSVTNAENVTTEMKYDGLNRLKEIVTHTSKGDIKVSSFTYDKEGRIKSSTDAEGNLTRVEYDALGNVVRVFDAYGNIIKENTYDNVNQLSKSTDANGSVTQYNHNKAGEVTKIIECLNSNLKTETEYSYDVLGRVKKVIDPEKGTSEYTYDHAGNITQVKDPMGGVTKYSYDSMKRITEVVNAMGSKSTYKYNADGLLAESKNARLQNTTYTYDKLGRIRTKKDQAGTVTYTYDNVGNIVKVKDSKGTITREYDKLNRVKKYTDCNGKTVTYNYDELGNRIELTYPGGQVVRYTYYKNGWLHTVTDAEKKVTTYTYDKNGRLTNTKRANGTIESRTYDKAGNLKTQLDKKGSTVLNRYSYQYDARGNITSVSQTEKENIASLTQTQMKYDKANRLISYNGKQVKYDADGNMTYGPLNGTMTTFQYDCRNRLIQAGDTKYEYDAEDTRIAVQTKNIREEYVTDKEAAYSQTLSVTTYKKNILGIFNKKEDTTTYIYGNGLISETSKTNVYL